MEEAVYQEFESISERGGVLGAMDRMQHRGKIQDESLYYEHKKYDGSLPLVGINTYLARDGGGEMPTDIELIRSSGEEKQQQIDTVKTFAAARNPVEADSLQQLQQTARERNNLFEQRMEAVTQLPGPDPPCPLRSGRGVSAEYVTGGCKADRGAKCASDGIASPGVSSPPLRCRQSQHAATSNER